MSSFSKAGVIAAAATAALAVVGGIFWAYKSYEKQQEDIVEAPNKPQLKQQQLNIQQEINKLRNELDLNNLTIEDVKRVFLVLTDYIKAKTIKLSNKQKQDRRRAFPKEIRFQRFPQYFRASMDNMMTLQNQIMQLQQEQNQILNSLGLTQAKMAQFGHLLAPFMQELLMSTDISVEQVREHLQLKAEYLEVHGARVMSLLIELAASLSLQEKQFIPLFLNTILSDECFEHQPNLDKEEFDIAAEKHKNDLATELNRLEQILMPLMGELQTALVGDGMGDMGGYGGMGGYGDYDQMGGMGGMGMGYNEQAIQQQLEMIRQQDPQAYEQLMAMMQAQMGR